jgi:rRNA maturation protein Nop10
MPKRGVRHTLPGNRRKYCSDKCARIVNKDNATARARRRTAAIEAKGGPQVAIRICLSCDRPFLSEGNWNRICPRCGERNVAAPPRAEPVPLDIDLKKLGGVLEE